MLKLTDDDLVFDSSAMFLLVLVDDSCETGVYWLEGGEDGQEKAHHDDIEQQHQGNQPVLEKGVPVIVIVFKVGVKVSLPKQNINYELEVYIRLLFSVIYLLDFVDGDIIDVEKMIFN